GRSARRLRSFGSSGRSGNTLGDGGDHIALQNLAALAGTFDLVGRQIVLRKHLGRGRGRRHVRGGRLRSGSRLFGRLGGSSFGRLCGRSGRGGAGCTFGNLAEQRIEADRLTILGDDLAEDA